MIDKLKSDLDSVKIVQNIRSQSSCHLWLINLIE